MSNNLSQGAKDLLVKVRQIVPPLLEKFHKGETLLQLLPIPMSTDMGLPHPLPPARSIGKGCSNWRQRKVRSVRRYTVPKLQLRIEFELLNSYTGAPYFSAIASARLGADLVPSLHPLLFIPSRCLALSLKPPTLPPPVFTVPRHMHHPSSGSNKKLLPQLNGTPSPPRIQQPIPLRSP